MKSGLWALSPRIVFQWFLQYKYFNSNVVSLEVKVNTVSPSLPAAAPESLCVVFKLSSGLCDSKWVKDYSDVDGYSDYRGI